MIEIDRHRRHRICQQTIDGCSMGPIHSDLFKKQEGEEERAKMLPMNSLSVRLEQRQRLSNNIIDAKRRFVFV